MPTMSEAALREYTNLLRDRDTQAIAIGDAQASVNTATGLLRNYAVPSSEKFKTRYKQQNDGAPAERKMSFEQFLARERNRLSQQLRDGHEMVTMFQKGLTHAETRLKSFISDHPDIGQLTLESALELISQDPSADTTPTERLADEAASNLLNTQATESIVSIRS